MDKQLIERAAKEAGIDLRHHYDETGLTVADLSKFIASIDAERGKEAVAYLRFWAGRIVSPDGGVECDEGLEVCQEGEVGADGEKAHPVFLSTTIPEGMASVPIEPPSAYIAAICDETLCSRTTAEYAYQAVITCAQGDMLAAAQGDRNAD